MTSTYEVTNSSEEDRIYFNKIGVVERSDRKTHNVTVEDDYVDELCEYLDDHDLVNRLV